MTYIKNNHLLHKENKKMNKIEAQKIIDDISPDTIIDPNWLDYLLEEKGLRKLQALQELTDKNWKEFIDVYEGESINMFQSEWVKPVEIYVGKTIKHLDKFYLIVAQDELYFYYVNTYGRLECVSLNDVNNYLI